MTTKRMDFTRKNKGKTENIGHMEIKDAATFDGVELYLYGDIVSSSWDKWSAEDTCPQDISDFLADIDNNADMTVYFNSCGGDVFAGIGIYNILMRHSGHIKGVVDSLAASIASVILMACDEIVVSTGAQIMVHKPSTFAWGNADDLRDTIARLDECQKMITDIYMTKAKDGVAREDIEALIDAETWLSVSPEAANKASDYFDIAVDEAMTPVTACSSVMMNNFKNVPKDIIEKTTAAVEEQQKKQKEADEILADLFMYGA